MIVTLTHFNTIPKGTTGKLLIPAKKPVLLYTLEPPGNQNKKDISCIPKGTYTCIQVISPTFGKTYQVVDVPNRDNILFHCGNFLFNTHGCIFLCLSLTNRLGEDMLLNSKIAFSKFLDTLLPLKEFTLEIK